MKSLILISTLAVVYCSSENVEPVENKSTVEIEKQEVVELKTAPKLTQNGLERRQIEEATREILEKIKKVNQNQGHHAKDSTPVRNVQIPHYYSYSHDQAKPTGKYFYDQNVLPYPPSSYYGPSPQPTKAGYGYTNMKFVDEPVEILADNSIPGYSIRRKVTQHKTYTIPAQNMAPQVYGMPIMMIQTLPKVDYGKEFFNSPNQYAVTDDLQQSPEEQTIDAIKNIIMKSQLPPNVFQSAYFNPLVQNLPYYSPNSFMYDNIGYANAPPYPPWNGYGFSEGIGRRPTESFSSLTTMVEYEKIGDHQNCNRDKPSCAKSSSSRASKSLIRPETYEIEDVEKATGIEILGLNPVETPTEDNPLELRLENIAVTTSANNRGEKQIQDKSKQNAKPVLIIRATPSVKNQQVKPDEEEEEEDLIEMGVEEEAEKNLSHQTNDKKVFSKDNVGNGIFIQKLKVRKGGVAIAGPGGIATAGTGGTAIVGPNGWAYTHPDSLAIAGSGTKVIAVDPGINLMDIISRNGTRKDDYNPRIGKVVAIGPVVYYNRG